MLCGQWCRNARETTQVPREIGICGNGCSGIRQTCEPARGAISYYSINGLLIKTVSESLELDRLVREEHLPLEWKRCGYSIPAATMILHADYPANASSLPASHGETWGSAQRYARRGMIIVAETRGRFTWFLDNDATVAEGWGSKPDSLLEGARLIMESYASYHLGRSDVYRMHCACLSDGDNGMVDRNNPASGTGFVLSWKVIRKSLVGGEIDSLELCRGLQEHHTKIHPRAETGDRHKTHKTGMDCCRDLPVLQDMQGNRVQVAGTLCHKGPGGFERPLQDA